jgi:hypothetical protein
MCVTQVYIHTCTTAGELFRDCHTRSGMEAIVETAYRVWVAFIRMQGLGCHWDELLVRVWEHVLPWHIVVDYGDCFEEESVSCRLEDSGSLIWTALCKANSAYLPFQCGHKSVAIDVHLFKRRRRRHTLDIPSESILSTAASTMDLSRHSAETNRQVRPYHPQRTQLSSD